MEPKPEEDRPPSPRAATQAEQAAKLTPDLTDEERRRLAETASREEDA